MASLEQGSEAFQGWNKAGFGAAELSPRRSRMERGPRSTSLQNGPVLNDDLKDYF